MNKLLQILLMLGIIFCFTVSAGAWSLEMGDSYSFGDYWAVDVSFTGETTDNLNDLNFSVAYDTDDLSFVAPYLPSYDNGLPFPLTETYWEGGALPHNAETPGLVYNLMGGEVLGNAGVFFPVATGDTLIATLYFNDLGAADNSSVNFVYGKDYTGAAFDAVTVNGITTANAELDITGKSISNMPVPAAVWLLGSGLFGLFGVRRFKK